MPLADDLIDWLLGDARQLEAAGELLRQLGLRLVERGVPAWRLTLHMPQFHPQLGAVTYEWLADTDEVKATQVARQLTTTQTYFHSPIALLHRSARLVRRRLTGGDADIDFPVLEEIRDRGGTDYALFPLPIGPRIVGFSMTTRQPNGFHQRHLALIEAMTPAFGTVVEIFINRARTKGLLETYLGPEATKRILSGQIARGSVRSIHAVIFFSDLRGYTALSETLPSSRLIALLNDYFGAMVRAVTRPGGEVLKFMGDGMLAIFPLGAEETEDIACARALSAAREAMAELEDVNEQRLKAGEPPVRVGIALHVGSVLYGNIGGESRLDFTVVGPAVNRAARIEALCRELGEPILASRRFAQSCPLPLRSVGRHVFRGVEKPQEVFAAADAPLFPLDALDTVPEPETV